MLFLWVGNCFTEVTQLPIHEQIVFHSRLSAWEQMWYTEKPLLGILRLFSSVDITCAFFSTWQKFSFIPCAEVKGNFFSPSFLLVHCCCCFLLICSITDFLFPLEIYIPESQIILSLASVLRLLKTSFPFLAALRIGTTVRPPSLFTQALNSCRC